MLVIKMIIQQTKKNNIKSDTYSEIGKPEKERNPGATKSERKAKG